MSAHVIEDSVRLTLLKKEADGLRSAIATITDDAERMISQRVGFELVLDAIEHELDAIRSRGLEQLEFDIVD